MQDTINYPCALQSRKSICRRTKILGQDALVCRSLIRNFMTDAEPQVSADMKAR